jgi:hypothetical protein
MGERRRGGGAIAHPPEAAIMGAVRITQLDGTLPNLALMRLSDAHKAMGDEVRFYRSPYRHLDEPRYMRVYGSAIFKFSAQQVNRLQAEFPEAIIGGTGTSSSLTVDEYVQGWAGLDYDLYPDFTASIGFTQRGCRLSCKFCVVPGKEGRPREESTIAEIWRGEGHPKHIHLLDNDFFGGPAWRERISEIREGGFKVSFTQGINVRAMTDEVAAALATVEYRDNHFRERRLYTAWDNLKDEEIFFRGVDTLERHGIPAKHLRAYMLVGFDKRETWERIFHRFHRMVERGVEPYPMPFDQERRDLKRFQRWAVTGLYRAVPFESYDANRKSSTTPPKDHPDLFLTSPSVGETV